MGTWHVTPEILKSISDADVLLKRFENVRRPYVARMESRLVIFGTMLLAVTSQIASAAAESRVLITDQSSAGIGANDAQIEIDQMTVVHAAAAVYPVTVVAHRARSSCAAHVLVVLFEAHVLQYASADVVTFVAQRVSGSRIADLPHRVAGRCRRRVVRVIALQQVNDA